MAWLYCQCFVTESLHMEKEGKHKELRASEEVRTKDVNLGTTCIGKRLLSNESLWSLRKSKRARTEPWEYRPPCIWPSSSGDAEQQDEAVSFWQRPGKLAVMVETRWWQWCDHLVQWAFAQAYFLPDQMSSAGQRQNQENLDLLFLPLLFLFCFRDSIN